MTYTDVKDEELSSSDLFPLDPKIKREGEKFFKAAKTAQNVLISSTLTSDGIRSALN